MKLPPRSVLLQATGFTLVSLVLGLTGNWIHPKQVTISWHRPPVQYAPDTVLTQNLPDVKVGSEKEIFNSDGEIKIVSTKQVRKILSNNGAILLDARSPEAFREETISGAINLPIEQLFDYEKELQTLPKDKWLICFCSDEMCDLGNMLAMELQNYGFTRIVYYKAGLEDWKAHQLPTTKGAS